MGIKELAQGHAPLRDVTRKDSMSIAYPSGQHVVGQARNKHQCLTSTSSLVGTSRSSSSQSRLTGVWRPCTHHMAID